MSRSIEHASQAAGRRAAAFFGNGFHCAEAVLTAVLETLGKRSLEASAHATAFGGGFGKTFEEACGALSGSLIVIGHLYGRQVPKDDWSVPAELGAEIRSRFLSTFGTTNCGVLRQRFGEADQMDECRKIVGATAVLLTDLLSEEV